MNPESRAPLSRRDVLKGFLLIPPMLSACSADNTKVGATPATRPTDKIQPAPTPTQPVKIDATPATLSKEYERGLGISEIRESLDRAYQVYHRIFKTDATQIQKGSLQIANSYSEFVDLMKKYDPNYIMPKNEDEIPLAMVTDRLLFNTQAVNRRLELVFPANTTRIKDFRADFLDQLFMHELAHEFALPYASPKIHEQHSKLVRDHKNVKGYNIRPGGEKDNKNIVGATVRTFRVDDSTNLVYFTDVEEAEALTIDDFVRSQTEFKTPYRLPRPKGIEAQSKLYGIMAATITPKLDNYARNLFSQRAKIGGREELFEKMARTYDVEKERSIEFGLLLQDAIESGSTTIFKDLTSRSVGQIPGISTL